MEIKESYKLNSDELHALCDYYLRMANECNSEIIDPDDSFLGCELCLTKEQIEEKVIKLKIQRSEYIKKLSYFSDELQRLIEREKEAAEVDFQL
jgi:hypothetical protein